MPQTADQSHPHRPKRCSRCGAAAIHGNGVVLTQCSVALPPPSRQRECKIAQYCSYTCKEIHWPSHRKVCVNEHKFLKDHPHQRASLFWRDDAPLNVRPDFADECGVVAFATRPWENEHGNQLPPPVLAPCTELIGIPLMLRARSYPEISYLEERVLGPVVAASPALPSRLLMMDPDTGHVSTLWNSPETYCEAYRQDDTLLKPETLETILQFCYTVLQDGTSAPRTDDWSAPRAFFTPAAFELFSRTYFREQREKGRVGFDGPFVPL